MLRDRALLPALLALSALPYLPGLSNGFVWLDHKEIVEGMLVVERWSEVPSVFVDDRNFAGYHRPFYDLLHSLDRALWRLDPFGFHLSSLLLHLANVALVLALARRAAPSRGAAWAIAALWGLHPVSSAAVGLIHAKADLFVTTALAGSLWLLLDAARSGRWPLRGALSLACFAVALLTKETAFVLPLAVALSLLDRTSDGPRDRTGRTRAWLAGWIAAASAMALAVLLPRVAEGSAFTSSVPLGERLLTFATVYCDDLRKLVLPIDLTVADTVTRFSALTLVAKTRYLGLLALLAVLQVQAWRQLRWTRPWILVWNLGLLPVSQIVPILHFRADRFLYLPSLGVVALAVLAAARLVERARDPVLARRAAALVLAIVCAAFALRTAWRVRDFESDERLFTAELRRTPDYVEGLAALARARDRAGRFRDAERLWRAALAPHPGRISYASPEVLLVNYAHNLLAQGRPAEAYELLRSADARAGTEAGRAEIRYNLAVAAFRLDRYGEALPLLTEYARAHPGDASAHYLLGRCAEASGERETARAAFEAYLRIAPRAPDRAEVEGRLRNL